jgi:hypothetical protein
MRQLLAAGLLATFVGAAIAQAADKPNPSGEWKWSVSFNGRTRDAALTLKLDGDKLNGALAGRNGRNTPIQDAKYKDGELSFSIVREGRNGEKMTTNYKGKLSGDTIKGKMEFERNGEKQSRDWEAKRAVAAKPAAAKKAAPAAGNPVGKWALTVDVNGSPYEFTVTLKGDVGKLSGTIAGDDGNEKPLQDVKFKDGTLTFTAVREQDGEKMLIKNTGKLSGDTIKGKAEVKLGDEPQSLPWEAKRAK